LPQFTEQSPTSTPDFDLARSAVAEATQSRRSIAQRQLALDQERGWSRQDLERQMMYRRFTPGDVYAPHDLTGVEFSKWKKQRRKEKTKYDVLDQLNVNPEHHYKVRAVGAMTSVFKKKSPCAD
jgi:small subunit ribosomal protein S18